jgi:hypothetical protein
MRADPGIDLCKKLREFNPQTRIKGPCVLRDACWSADPLDSFLLVCLSFDSKRFEWFRVVSITVMLRAFERCLCVHIDNAKELLKMRA